jgi:hypothetical protein
MNITTLDTRILIEPIKQFKFDGTWIAGGYIRDLIVGDKYNDIDIFGRNKESLDKFKDDNLANCKCLYDTPELKTYDYQGTKVQLIYRFYPDIEACLESFDFTICQFAYDGQLRCNAEAIVHLFNKQLIIHKLNGLYLLDSMRRMQKYIQRGYTICNDGLMQIITAARSASAEDIKKSFDYYPITNTIRIRRWD